MGVFGQCVYDIRWADLCCNRTQGRWKLAGICFAVRILVSTAFVLLSSISLQWSLVQARRDELGKLKLGLVLTLFLGLLFLFSQWVAFQQMVSVGLYLVGNPSTSFLYVITGLHGLHMLSAVVVLFVIFAQVFQYKVHSKNMLSIRLGTLYWHFLGVLWIYLYVFFQLIF
jgi:cytochrome c oxidase subunit 3